MGLFFMPQVVYEHGKPQWNDVEEENPWLVHQSSLAILPLETSGSEEEEWAKGMRI
jgi:hypothetical protein